MVQKKEIQSLEEIKQLVDLFYGKVRKDPLLADIFNAVIKDNWPVHLEKMYRFWQTVLLQEHTYQGSPFAPHAKLRVNKAHFNRWKQLFFETVDENFHGEKAVEAKFRAEKMAEMFQLKIEYIQKHT
ncbi:group III truncated hemoglobin [Flagellimonas halotolerans]|uniref:Group III truncated hemoglobin n=1 Tax=Flagellimonas halotolerans TaxID=3112164 RepID=A0ABU6IT08_9FLAO|nr:MULTISPECIES: group III truncated hemoglobin [unclassified Allomuricauda]MBA4743628.1 group III truncated hemoglobin [Allomuricauda sp.]MEC3966387.1 group III truncated hemoglobin [Muricauda sp. SYSU M86414]MEC4266252.1 group III truncated hemoglobin [Muricauda sp. SYSU M84420]